MSIATGGTLFDAYYYAHGCGLPYERTTGWIQAFDNLAARIVQDLQPRTVLDAGCAKGFLVEALRRRGVEAWGVDISEYAIQSLPDQIRPFCRVGSITEPLARRYDLIVCIEVLEHIPLREAEKAAENLCRFTDDILFSSTPFDYGEATHFNVQVPEYWGELFARQGFFRDVDFDASFITPWAVRFRRRTETISRLARDYERRYWSLWKENVDLRQSVVNMRQQIAIAALDKEIPVVWIRLGRFYAQVVRRLRRDK
jgi:SAM-dependent methyltransferase